MVTREVLREQYKSVILENTLNDVRAACTPSYGRSYSDADKENDIVDKKLRRLNIPCCEDIMEDNDDFCNLLGTF